MVIKKIKETTRHYNYDCPLEDLRIYTIENRKPEMISSKQEYLENSINRFI